MQAPQVEYRVIVEGQQHFDCALLRATLSTKACALRWNAAREAEEERRDRLISCKRCPVGAMHFEAHRQHEPAEVPAAPMERKPPRASVCVRCGKPSDRLVGGELCVSDFNREREWLRGYNARGNPMRDYLPPRPWRVGVIEQDGRHTWRMFVGQHLAEAQARAVRAGFKLHEQHPGRSEWNPVASRFEYRAPDGHILLELEDDGRIEFIPVERLHPSEEPAQVVMPPILMTTEEGAAMLAGDESLTSDWRQTDLVCRRCGQGMLHARRYKGTVECRCSAGCC
mgnify:CR=1 FL=1